MVQIKRSSLAAVLTVAGILATGASHSAMAQTAPRFGGGGAATTTTDAAAGEKEFRIIPVNHVYVGGISRLFQGNVGLITTKAFVTTAGGASQLGTSNGTSGGNSQSGGFGNDQGGGMGGGNSGGFDSGNSGGGGGGVGGITF